MVVGSGHLSPHYPLLLSWRPVGTSKFAMDKYVLLSFIDAVHISGENT